MLLRLPGQGNRELNAISATSKGYRKLHFVCESRTIFKSLDKKRGVKDGTGISELRVLKPRPGVRILGGFLTEAAFIGLIMERRNRIAFKHKASEAGQRQWYELKAEALATFKTLFPNEKPLIPNALRDLESLGDEQ